MKTFGECAYQQSSISNHLNTRYCSTECVALQDWGENKYRCNRGNFFIKKDKAEAK